MRNYIIFAIRYRYLPHTPLRGQNLNFYYSFLFIWMTGFWCCRNLDLHVFMYFRFEMPVFSFHPDQKKKKNYCFQFFFKQSIKFEFRFSFQYRLNSGWNFVFNLHFRLCLKLELSSVRLESSLWHSQCWVMANFQVMTFSKALEMANNSFIDIPRNGIIFKLCEEPVLIAGAQCKVL